MNIEEFESFCSKNGSFTQSCRWASVKETWKPVYIVSKNPQGEVRGTMLLLMKKAPVLHTYFLYAPRGPVCDMKDRDVLEDLLRQVKTIAEKVNACMLKIDPLIDESDETAIKNLQALGFVSHPQRVGYDNIQCRENYVLNLKGRTPDEIFRSFKPKWRYNIRLAKKRGVRCGFFGEEKLDDFEVLMKETAKRDGFDMRDKAYFRKILRAFGKKARLCMCYLDSVPLSGALCIEYGGVMSYVYGCSSGKNRQYMPNYLMQWTMIERAVADGCHTYDFCGVPYWYDKNHKNYGVYRFKKGFSGTLKTYAGEFDYRFKPLLCALYDAVWWLRKHLF